MNYNNWWNNIITIDKKYLACTQKIFMILIIIISWNSSNFLIWVYLTYNSAINNIINRYFRNEIVTSRLIIQRKLEVIIILWCLWIGTKRNRGCRIRTHLINTFLNGLCYIGYFGRWGKRSSQCKTYINLIFWGSYWSIFQRWWSSSISWRV